MTFSRNKLVGIEYGKEGSLLVHGVLDDNIYGMEIDFEVNLPDLEITAINGEMKRFTNPGCPPAVPVLQNAVGLRLNQEDLAARVNREVGRKGCRHFANLLLECADAVIQAVTSGEAMQQGSLPNLQRRCMAYSETSGKD